MLRIKKYDEEYNYRTLEFSCDLFHKALKNVLNGEKCFHVVENNKELFDLVYTDNNEETFADPAYPNTTFFRSSFFFPPYYLYDENDKSKLYLDVFKGFDNIWFEETNEYTIICTKLVLKYTNLNIYFSDDRINLFLNEKFGFVNYDKKRIIIAYPHDDTNTLRIIKGFSAKTFTNQFREYGSIGLFHDVFILQWLTDLPLENIKYVEMCVAKSEGIGSLLGYYAKVLTFFKEFGIETILKKHSSRYSDEMIEKYFSIKTTAIDSNESNTIHIENFLATFVGKHFMESRNITIDTSIFNKQFLNELNEYKDAIIADKKMLGLLIRGSDYYSAGCEGIFKPATVDELLPTINKWYVEDNYDGIFLATEDKDVLNQMLKEFPHKIVAISQERYSKDDFKDVSSIHELDKENNNENLEDTTINYFYALYLLSNCESFLASSQCNGIAIVESFKKGKFKRFANYRMLEKADL